MNWYYQKGQEQAGPVEESEILKLAEGGQIQDATLVWKEGMENWKPYAEVKGSLGSGELVTEGTGQRVQQEMVTCSVSGKSVPKNEAIELNDRWVSAEHKNEALERIKSGMGMNEGVYEYVGFWWRVLAKIVDSIIICVGMYGLMFLLAIPFGIEGFLKYFIGETEGMSMGTIGLYFDIQMFASFGVPITYDTWMVGKFQATLGKKLIGAKVIRSDGSRLTYFRAFGRYWGSVLSQLIMCIGYIMVAFDSEKRGLHDRICDTLVVKK